ncbi:ABC transporter permease subunit [Bacillus sp. SL00103]
MKLGLLPTQFLEWIRVYNFAHNSISYVPISICARFMRTEMVEVLETDYILLAKAKGAGYFELAFKHAMEKCVDPCCYSSLVH